MTSSTSSGSVIEEGVVEMWFRPVAVVCVSDRTCRAKIAAVLERHGWNVLEVPTGFHVVQELAGVITGDMPWKRPGLIVIDAIARGCSGSTIAHGLRELGAKIPVVLVTRECSPYPDGEIITVDPAIAAHVVGELARPRSSLQHFVPARAVA